VHGTHRVLSVMECLRLCDRLSQVAGPQDFPFGPSNLRLMLNFCIPILLCVDHYSAHTQSSDASPCVMSARICPPMPPPSDASSTQLELIHSQQTPSVDFPDTEELLSARESESEADEAAPQQDSILDEIQQVL